MMLARPHLPARPIPRGRRLLRDRRAAVGAIVLVIVIAVALCAPLVAPYDPAAQLDIVRLQGRPPSLTHPLGTDAFSRDVLSRVIYGARVSLGVAAVAVTLSMTLGIFVGMIAGLSGGAIDATLMRFVDVALSIPQLLLLIVVAALWGALGTVPLALLIAGTGWFPVSRMVRARTLVVREQDFLLATRALGATTWRLLVRHIMPNVTGPALVAGTLLISDVILLEAGLSYLGIGVRPPAASWGSIIEEGAQRVGDLWWLTLFPGLAILITAFASNALGDALRDMLDPRQLPFSPGDDTVHQTQ